MAQFIWPASAAVVAGSVSVNIHDSAGSNITNGQKTMANSVPVAIASDQSAVPISAASLPLPTGAATAAKQPALGTAGAASADVISVQGIASMTPLKVDASATTQPVSGSVTANIGTTNGLALDASVNALQVAQGSATAGQKGGLLQGAVTTAAPTYTTGQTSPVSLTPAGAVRVDASATTQPVSVAVAIPTKSPVNANGSIVNTPLTATTASSATAPANAVGFILEAPSTNTNNINWCIGGTASTTVGMLMEPGRDTGFIPCAATISVCAAVSGTNAFSIQWILSA